MAQLYRLCLLALLASAVVAEDAVSTFSLPADGEQVASFKSEFGPPLKIRRSQLATSYSRKYVPEKNGPDYGVPARCTDQIQYVPWTDKMYCQDYGCFNPAPNPEPYFPTIYDWVSNNPALTIVKQIMDIIGPEVFNGPFTGTLFLPTDQAMAIYLAGLAIPPADLTSPEYKEFLTNFFIKLLQYHTLLRRVYGAQFAGATYSTAYANLNGFPHRITFGSGPGCGGGCGSGGCGGGCGSGGCGGACGSGGCGGGCGSGGCGGGTGGCSGTGCDGSNGCSGCSGCNGGNGNSNGYKYTVASRKRHIKDYYSTKPPCSTGCSGGCSGCSGGCNGGGCGSGGCSGCSGGCSGCSGGCGCGCGCAVNYLIDEQGNIVTFDQVDKFVYGGGVVHTVNSVLQPNDIFPSLGAAVQGDQFSILRAALAKIDVTLNATFLELFEQAPGTFAVPNNEAFSGIDIDTTPADQLVYIVSYHFCNFKRAYRLLYTPFNGKPGKNPCLSLFSRATGFEYGLLWNFTSNGLTERPNMWITYATPNADGQLEVATTTIIVPDITMPVHTAHVINKVMIPPDTGSNGVRAASAVLTTLSSKDATAEATSGSKLLRSRYKNAGGKFAKLSPTALRKKGNHKRLLRLFL